MIKQYDKYKDSGIEWVGKIPNDWSKLKIGRSFNRIGSGTTPKSGSDLYYENGSINWLNTGDLNDSFITETSKKITVGALNEFSTLKVYPKDSIVIALYGATIGKLGQLKIETTTNQACCVLTDSNEILNRYLFYYFLSAREYIISKAYGGGQPNISQDLIKQLYVSTPSIDEQTKIVNYLDHQTSIIDQLIQQKEKLIELLKEKRQAVMNEAITKGLNPNAKMKDSGIEWLGEIPIKWALTPLKHFASLKGRLGWKGLKAEEYVEKGFGFLSTPDIKNDIIDFNNINFITEERFLESPEIILEVGDILLVKDGSTLGIVNMVKELPIPSTVNSSIGIIKVFDKNVLFPEYLLWLLKSDYIQVVINRLKAGQGVPHLFQKDIKNFIIILPPIKEQKEIVQHIESRNTIVEYLFRTTEKQVEKLKEYRQSIISEVVTGKIDVRDWKMNKRQVA